jgi:hypothetical protein
MEKYKVMIEEINKIVPHLKDMSREELEETIRRLKELSNEIDKIIEK